MDGLLRAHVEPLDDGEAQFVTFWEAEEDFKRHHNRLQQTLKLKKPARKGVIDQTWSPSAPWWTRLRRLREVLAWVVTSVVAVAAFLAGGLEYPDFDIHVGRSALAPGIAPVPISGDSRSTDNPWAANEDFDHDDVIVLVTGPMNDYNVPLIVSGKNIRADLTVRGTVSVRSTESPDNVLHMPDERLYFPSASPKEERWDIDLRSLKQGSPYVLQVDATATAGFLRGSLEKSKRYRLLVTEKTFGPVRKNSLEILSNGNSCSFLCSFTVLSSYEDHVLRCTASLAHREDRLFLDVQRDGDGCSVDIDYLTPTPRTKRPPNIAYAEWHTSRAARNSVQKFRLFLGAKKARSLEEWQAIVDNVEITCKREGPNP
jgi:hypothetical protein